MVLSTITQLVNGHVYDFSSISVDILGAKFTSFQEINYSFEGEAGELRGNGSAIVKAFTRGEYSFSGNVVLAKRDAMELIKLLAAAGSPRKMGFSEIPLEIVVTYSEFGQAVPDVDALLGARFITGSNEHSRSADPLFMGFDLVITDILYNGASPVTSASGGGLGGLIGGLIP